MTSKEAFDKVKGFILELRDTKYIEYKKYTDILNDLVERDTPMKLKSHNNGRSYCGVCGKSKQYDYSGNENVFCGGCGQRIDWSKL